MTELWVPDTHRDELPKWRCRICGQVFYENESATRERHTVKCIEANRQELHEMSPRVRLPEIFDPELGDPEYEQHVRNLPPEKIHEDGTWDD